MVSNSEEANWSNLQKQLKTDRKKQLQKPANIKRTYEILAKKLRSQPQASNSEPSNINGGSKNVGVGGGGGSGGGNKLRASNGSSGGSGGGGGGGSEENSYLSRYKHQQQLTNNNNNHHHQTTPNDRNNPTHNNKTSNNNINNNNNGGKKKARFKDDQQNGGGEYDSETSSLDQQHILAEQNMILNSSSFYNNYSPLSTPANYRNNTPARMSDPFGVNPLPNIRSPYFSARDSFYPNLESWGINNTSALYDDPYYLSRHSPFLPVYSSVTKNSSKPYIVVPRLDSYSRYKQTSPVPIIYNNNDSNFDSNIRLNYINPIPYNRQIADSNDLKSDEYIKNAQKLLNNKSPNNYDGEELFSTKFLEELEYKPGPKPATTTKKKPKPPATTPPPKTPPKSVQKRERDALALDIAENIYQREIELMIRRLAESTFKEEMTEKLKYQRPIYESIYEPMIAKMIKDIAREVIDDYERKIQILQTHEIKKVAREQIVNNLMLDYMLDSVAQQNKSADSNSDDDVNKLLDTMSLEILLNCQVEVRKFKEKTLKNYPIKKFHLNSFMNVALDILVAELSSSLEDDMKELEKIERT